VLGDRVLQGVGFAFAAGDGSFLGLVAPSAEERAAGMPFHGEASKQVVKVIASRNSGAVRSVVL
jgi:hypothetical protein